MLVIFPQIFKKIKNKLSDYMITFSMLYQISIGLLLWGAIPSIIQLFFIL